MNPERTTPSRETAFANWDDVVEIESIDFELSRGNVICYAWCRLHDGRDALWEYDLRLPPGQDQRLMIIQGA